MVVFVIPGRGQLRGYVIAGVLYVCCCDVSLYCCIVLFVSFIVWLIILVVYEW